MLGLLNKSPLESQLHIRNPKRASPHPSRQIRRVIRRPHPTQRHNRMHLNIRNRAPVKLERRPHRIHLRRRPIRLTKHIRLVMPQIHRRRIIRLKRRPRLCPRFHSSQHQHTHHRASHQPRSQPPASSPHPRTRQHRQHIQPKLRHLDRSRMASSSCAVERPLYSARSRDPPSITAPRILPAI